MEEELVKMSSKGQLVVPGSIRKKEKFKPTDRFVAIDVKGRGSYSKEYTYLTFKLNWHRCLMI